MQQADNKALSNWAREQLEAITQKNDHDLLITIAERMIHINEKLDKVDNRLWGAIGTGGLAILALLAKAFFIA